MAQGISKNVSNVIHLYHNPPPILFWVNENRVNTENINIQTQILFNPKHKNTEIKIISTIYKPKRDLLKENNDCAQNDTYQNFYFTFGPVHSYNVYILTWPCTLL